METLTVKKFFALSSEELFKYFIDAHLIEKWAYPDGMSLKITKFKAEPKGQYRYEHSGKNGLYVAEGHFEEIVPNKKVVMVDEFGRGPSGKVLFNNLKCVITIEDNIDGSEVTVTQSGFESYDVLKDCREGWTQCLDHLYDLVEKEIGITAQESRMMDEGGHPPV